MFFYLDEVAHYEPSHQDLRCLQIQLFSSLVLKELILKIGDKRVRSLEYFNAQNMLSAWLG